MFTSARTLFTVRGIDIRADASWLIIAGIIAWSLFSRMQVIYDHGVAVALPLAIAGAVLFFGSVLVHELAHALEGQYRGARVHGITLFLFGGATESDMNFERPRDELAMSAVGPWVSLVTAGAIGLIVTGLDAWGPAGIDAVTDLLGIVGWVNVGLGIFNLLPGAPLDGGRVLRAAVWRVTGSRDRGVRVAARAGQALGLALAGLGVLQFLAFAGGSFGGIWFIVLGWFLYAAAKRELTVSDLRRLLSGYRAEDLVAAAPLTIGEDATAQDVAHLLTRHDPDVAAVTAGGETVGVVTVEQLSGLSAQQRERRPVRDVMTARAELAEIDADDPAADVLDRIGGDDPVLIVGEDGPRGILTPERVATVLGRLRRLGVPGGGRSDGDDGWIPSRDRTDDDSRTGGVS